MFTTSIIQCIEKGTLYIVMYTQ